MLLARLSIASLFLERKLLRVTLGIHRLSLLSLYLHFRLMEACDIIVDAPGCVSCFPEAFFFLCT